METRDESCSERDADLRSFADRKQEVSSFQQEFFWDSPQNVGVDEKHLNRGFSFPRMEKG